MKIKLHVDTKAYTEKPRGDEFGGIKARLQKDAKPISLTIGELVEKIGAGYAISPAVMTGPKAADWVEQQLFMVDVDHEDDDSPIMPIPKALEICKQNGLSLAFYYTTYHHTKQKPRYRLAFITSKPIRDERERAKIMDTLVSLFPQSDTACKNADRIFLGTNQPVKLCDTDTFVTKRAIDRLYCPRVVTVTMPEKEGELEQLIRGFDFLSYLEGRNGKYTISGNVARFENCEICKHKGNLRYYQDTNSFYCFSSRGEVGGNIINYIMHTEGMDKGQAIHKFKYELCGIKRKSDEWQRPIPFDTFKLPVFPAHCLPPILRKWVTAVSESTATMIDMACIAALALVAATVQRKYAVEAKSDYLEPLNMYALIVAAPGERKSPIIRLMAKPFYQYEKEENIKRQTRIDEQETTLNVLSKRIEQCEKEGDEAEAIQLKERYREIMGQRVRPLRLVADDVTAEALTSLLADNKGVLTVISTEGGLFETLAGRYSNSHTSSIDTVLKAHVGDNIHVDRKGRPPETIESPALTMLLAIQDNVLEGLMENATFRGRGLTARLLYCKPESPIGTRPFMTSKIPEELTTEYHHLIHTLLSISLPEKPHTLRLSEAALSTFIPFYNEVERNVLPNQVGDMRSWAAKYVGTVLRIAGILHCAYHTLDAGTKPISKKSITCAIEIGRYFGEHAQYAHAAMGADKTLQEAKVILAKLEQQPECELSKYDIYRLCRGCFRKTDDTLPALEILIEQGYLREIKHEDPTGGRPRKSTYRLNPIHFHK